MKNRLKTLVASMTKQKDGYDPDDKTEQGGRERDARKGIRDAVLSDPFGEPTRRAKRSLLVVSILVLVVNADLPIYKLKYFEALQDEISAATILGLLSVGLVYFLIIFIVSAGLEFSRWRYLGNNIVLKGVATDISAIAEYRRRIELNLPKIKEEPEKSAMQKVISETEKSMPDIHARITRTMAYYDSTSRLQWFRMIGLDLALPVIVGFFALWKVAALVLPMISTIWSA